MKLQELPPLADAHVVALSFAAAQAAMSLLEGDPPLGKHVPAQKAPCVEHATGVMRPDSVSGQYFPMGHSIHAELASVALYFPGEHALHWVGLTV